MTLLTVEKYSGISADRSHHRRKPVSHALWEKLNEQSIELNGYWWSAYLPLTGHNNDPYMTYLPLTQFSNRLADWGTRGVGAQFETECSENRTSIPRIFVQFNSFPFSVKGEWPDELLYSQVRTSLCTRRDWYGHPKNSTLFQANLHSVSVSASEFWINLPKFTDWIQH